MVRRLGVGDEHSDARVFKPLARTLLMVVKVCEYRLEVVTRLIIGDKLFRLIKLKRFTSTRSLLCSSQECPTALNLLWHTALR